MAIAWGDSLTAIVSFATVENPVRLLLESPNQSIWSQVRHPHAAVGRTLLVVQVDGGG